LLSLFVVVGFKSALTALPGSLAAQIRVLLLLLLLLLLLVVTIQLPGDGMTIDRQDESARSNSNSHAVLCELQPFCMAPVRALQLLRAAAVAAAVAMLAAELGSASIHQHAKSLCYSCT
jgi:hypothetical protein